jgi:hypothetical protein
MKTIKEYINEMLIKDKFKMIPFDLFERYIKTSIVDHLDDDCEEYYEVLQVFVDNFGATADCLKYFRSFVAWSQQFPLLNISIEEFYEMFGNLKWENMKRLAGVGSYGAVFDKDDEKVIKLFFNGLTSQDKEFFTICKEHPEIKVFPTVYGFGDKWVVMEKLDVNSPKVNKYNEYLFRLKSEKKHIFDGNVISDYISDLAKGLSIPATFIHELEKDKFAKEVWNWVKQVDKACKKYCSPKLQMNWLDWHPGNFGQRKNGDIVFFDV